MPDDRLADLSALAQEVAELYAARFGATPSPDRALLKLTEELGELSGAWLRQSGVARPRAGRVSLEDEVADVLGFLLVFAAETDIDPAAALERKWGRHASSRRRNEP